MNFFEIFISSGIEMAKLLPGLRSRLDKKSARIIAKI